MIATTIYPIADTVTGHRLAPMPITAEVRAFLTQAGYTRPCHLTAEGFSLSVSRRLLGIDPGGVSVEALERAAALTGRAVITWKLDRKRKPHA